MTFAGKIFVVVIMAFSFLFLGLSTVAINTHPRWKEQVSKASEKKRNLDDRLNTAKKDVEAANKALAAAKAEREAATKQLTEKLAAAQNDIKKSEDEIAKARKELDETSQEVRTTLEKATAIKQEADQLRERKLAVQKLAGDYKARQNELNDEIRVLTRERDAARINNKDLRQRTSPSS